MSTGGRDSSKPDDVARRRDDEHPVLPQTSSDERDVGWGDEHDGGRRDDEWYQRERPPHHE